MLFIVYPRLLRAARRVAALTCLAVFAGGGVALASCPSQPVSTPFSQWGDSGNYFLLPGGSFEGTADQVGWDLVNAQLTSGTEPFNVNGTSDSQSLVINGGGTATSPYFCVDSSMSPLRFFAQQVSGGSDLEIEALVQTSRGVQTVPVAALADGSMSTWGPTQPIDGDTASITDSVMVALRFEVPTGGSWQIDDIYVDPYRSG